MKKYYIETWDVYEPEKIFDILKLFADDGVAIARVNPELNILRTCSQEIKLGEIGFIFPTGYKYEAITKLKEISTYTETFGIKVYNLICCPRSGPRRETELNSSLLYIPPNFS
jgi:hypothetical protein